MSRIWSVLFWSVIAAAFIGPGTVATAASAGASFGLSMLWALAFSTLACLVLQEAAARLTVVSGRTLGEALRLQYRGRIAGPAVLLLVLGSIVLGCAAYQAGNILGGVAGATLATGWASRWLTLAIGAVAAVLLFLGAPSVVARLLGLLVAVMGLAFVATAWRLGPSPIELLRGTLVPSFESGSGILVLGLVGTTVVPYNLFLGSGLARGQRLPELRFGLTVAVLLGGLVSMAVLVVGAALAGPMDFESLAGVLSSRLGHGAGNLFALGLFAAGMTSAITAPLAAAITARGLFAEERGSRWGDRSWRFRCVWGGVLAVGVGFGLVGVRPVPAILLAQALNGALLPFVSVFLLLAINDRSLLGERGVNGAVANVAIALTVAVAMLLGTAHVARAAAAAFGLPAPGSGVLLVGSILLSSAFAVPVWRAAVRRRRVVSPDYS